MVSEKVEIRDDKKKAKEPFWKRRIEKNMNSLRNVLSRIDDCFKGRWKNGRTKLKKKLRTNYKIDAKCFITVIEEIKCRITANAL